MSVNPPSTIDAAIDADRPAEAAILVRVLGGGMVEIDGGRRRISGRKHVGLLAYLALTPGPVPREMLANLLWGGSGEARARASLRQALSEVRGMHPEMAAALRLDRTTVELDPVRCGTDLDRLLRPLTRGDLPQALRHGVIPMDNVLFGLDAIGEEYAAWLRDLRTASQARLLTLLAAAAADAALPAATRLAMAETALAVDPLGERACRDVMALASDAGDLGRALQTYATFYARMEAELDMEPSLETQDLAVRIKLGAEEGPVTTPATATPTNDNDDLFGRPVLAVLPATIRGAGVPPDLAEMLADDLVHTLATVPELAVISRLSTRFVVDRPDVMDVLRRQLSATYVLGGTLQASGPGAFRLALELARVADGAIVWTETLELGGGPLGEVQDQTARTIVQRLLPKVRRAELRRVQRYELADLGAYHVVARAEELIFRLAREPFERAGTLLTGLARDHADFWPAHLLKADWHSLRVGQGWSPDAVADGRAVETALSAVLAEGRRDGRALAMLGHHKVILERRFGEAGALFDEALEMAPGDAQTLLWSGPGLAFMGDVERGRTALRRAMALAPDDPLRFRYEHFLGLAEYMMGDFEAAARLGAASMRRNGRYTSNLRATAAALAAAGRVEEAREIAGRVLTLEPGYRVATAAAHLPFADAGLKHRFAEHLRAAGLPN